MPADLGVPSLTTILQLQGQHANFMVVESGGCAGDVDEVSIERVCPIWLNGLLNFFVFADMASMIRVTLILGVGKSVSRCRCC